MSYDTKLADRIREHLSNIPDIEITEKKMFRGLTFMVNGKMCVNVSNDNLMCRFDPKRQGEIAEKQGYQPMIMKGKEYKGYCYIHPDGFKNQNDFEYYLNICLEFNNIAKSSKKR